MPKRSPLSKQAALRKIELDKARLAAKSNKTDARAKRGMASGLSESQALGKRQKGELPAKLERILAKEGARKHPELAAAKRAKNERYISDLDRAYKASGGSRDPMNPLMQFAVSREQNGDNPGREEKKNYVKFRNLRPGLQLEYRRHYAFKKTGSGWHIINSITGTVHGGPYSSKKEALEAYNELGLDQT